MDLARARSFLTLAAAFTAVSMAMTPGRALAHSGDHWPIGGDSLKMAYTSDGVGNRFTFKAKGELSINASSVTEDPTEERSTLLVRGTGASAGSTGIIELKPEYWKRIGAADAPRGWRYKNPNVKSAFTSGVQKIILRSAATGGSLQIVGKGDKWPFAIVGPQDSVQIELTLGGFAYCTEVSEAQNAEFQQNDGNSGGGRVYASGATPPAECFQSCGNGILESGEECDDGNFDDLDTCSNACVGCNPADAEFVSTFEGIQQLIFDSPTYGCSTQLCHGSAMSGGLDLRAGASHAALVNVASQVQPGTARVFPGDQDLSMLYLKLAANTLGTMGVPGTPMPSGGAPALTEAHLEAVREWIRAGAPDTGVVEGTAALLGTCLPPPTPKHIPQPAVPDPAVGSQLAMPGYLLTAQHEVEGCVASYYDLSAPGAVPPSMLVDCPGVFPGTNEHGTNAGKCFSYNGNAIFQDAQSHHSIVHIYMGSKDWNQTSAGAVDPAHSAWGAWQCYGGASAGTACDPSVAGVCGTDGVCGGGFMPAVACLGFGPPDASTFGNKMPQFSGSQESTNDLSFPDGVYSVLPLKGLVIWNSHAFNLTQEDTQMRAWINLGYTASRTWPALGLFDSTYIFTQDVPPFQQREYCATHTFAEGSHLFNLTSHNHKRGVRFRMYAPPQTVCANPGTGFTNPTCTPGSPADLFFESFQYTDPTTLNPDPPIVYSGTKEQRTIKFCGLFDNGVTTPVKTRSGSPTPTGGSALLPGGPCDDSDVACMGGINKGHLCHGNDSECPGSVCDACPLKGGVTTEDEMFIPIGTFYIP